MARCFGWASAAAEYEALYRRLIGPRAATAQPAPSAEQRLAAPTATPVLTELLESAA
jgi:hypothetical protein